MAVSRAQRRRDRHPKVAAAMDDADVEPALDLLELVELAWHDCFGEITPSDQVIDDILVVGHGNLGDLIGAARLAVADWRDLHIAADGERDQ